MAVEMLNMQESPAAGIATIINLLITQLLYISVTPPFCLLPVATCNKYQKYK